MTHDKQLREIWDMFAFTRLFRTFRIAVGPVKILLALMAITAICLTGFFLDICTHSVVTNSQMTELDVYIQNPENTAQFIVFNDKQDRSGVFSTMWHFGAARFNGATVSIFNRNLQNSLLNIWLWARSIVWAVEYHTFYSIVYFAAVSVIVCITGGAISRVAALEFARGEKPGITEALKFSISKFFDFLTAPFLALLMVIIFAAVIFSIGLVANIPWAGEIILALSTPLALICGLCIILVLIGNLAGTALMFPTIAYEGSNGREALSRSFVYIFSEPLQMVLYIVVAVIFGTISYLVVRFFAFLVLAVTHTILEIAIFTKAADIDKLTAVWPKPEFLNLLGTAEVQTSGWSPISFSTFIIHIFVLLTIGLVVAFVISFYFSANTIIYSLMRNKVDKTAFDKIYIHLDNVKQYQPPDTNENKE